MPYFLQYTVWPVYVGVGSGPMSVPMAQKMVFWPQPGPPIVVQTNPILDISGTRTIGGWPVGPDTVGILVPGGEAPTQANFRSALHGATTQPTGGAPGSLAGDIDQQIANNLTTILNWAKGGG